MKNKVNLSICAVVHNEEAGIRDYLSWIRGRAEEIILIDLGSTDRTVELSRNAGITVYSVQWNKNRSEIKNFCMEQASGRWVFFLQTDERLSDEHWNQLYSMLDNPNAEEYLVYVEPYAQSNGIVSPVDSLRLVRNRQEYRYQGRSYEYIPDEIIGNRRDSNLRIEKVREDKNGSTEFDYPLFDAERALLLSKDLEENPQSHYLLYRTGIVLMNQGQTEEAAHYLEAARETVLSDYFYAPHLYKCLVWCYLTEENPKADEMIEEGIRTYPAYLDLVILRGELRKQRGEYQEAIMEYERGLSLFHSRSLKTVGTEIDKPVILEHLGWLHEKLMNRGKAAICYYQMFHMGFKKEFALRKIGELLLQYGDEEGFEQIYDEAASKKELDSMLILMDVLFRYHQYSKVLKCLDDAETYLDSGETAFIKASCLKALGNHVEAKRYLDSIRMEQRFHVPILQQELETYLYEGEWEAASCKLSEIEADGSVEISVKTALRRIYQCLTQTTELRTVCNSEQDHEDHHTEHQFKHSCGEPLTPQEQEITEGILDQFLWMGRIEEAKRLLVLLLNGKAEQEKEEILKELAERDLFYGTEGVDELVSLTGIALPEPLTLLFWSRKMMKQLEQWLDRIPIKDSRSCINKEADFVVNADESPEYHLETGDRFAASGKSREAFFAYLQTILRDPFHEAACNRIITLLLDDEPERMADLYSDRWIMFGSYFEERSEFRDFIVGLYKFWRGNFSEALESFENCLSDTSFGSGTNDRIQIYLTSAHWLIGEEPDTAKQRIKDLPCSLKNGVFQICKKWILRKLVEYAEKHPDIDLITAEIEKIQENL